MNLLQLTTSMRDYYVGLQAHRQPKPNFYQILDQFYPSYTQEAWEGIQEAHTFVTFFELLNECREHIEFLVHNNHFEIDFEQWYNCPDTTSAEVVVLLNEMLRILSLGKPLCVAYPALSVSVVKE